MDSKTALDRIKEEEKKTGALIEKAKRDAHSITHRARLKKEELIKETRDRAAGDAARLRDDLLEETEREVREIAKQAEKEIETLRQISKKNFDKALEFLKSKIN